MVASDPMLAPGTVVLGEIRIESVICVSGVGALHRGRSTASDVPVLVRAMASEKFANAANAFAREVLVVRHLEHESIVAPLDAGVEKNHAIVAYEPVNGVVLQTQLAKSVPLSEVARIANELAVILDHAHRQPAPLLHAAITSSSIVLSGASRSVKLLDLGLVQALDHAHVLSDALWEVLAPAAAAPEQVQRTFPITPATDVFGLASLAYECLTGRPPFPAKNAAEAEAMIVSGKRPLARDVRHELNPEVDRLLQKAWSVDPRSRPHEIIAFANSLAAALIRPAGALAEPTDAMLNFDDDEEDAETINLPSKAIADLLEPMRAAAAAQPKAPRAQTLPFGLPKPAPSEPPPKERVIERPAAPKLVPVKEAEAMSEPAPAKVLEAQAPPRAQLEVVRDPEVQTVRVVNVTGMFVSLVFAGAVIIAGAFVGAGSLVAERNAARAPVIAPAPKPEPSHTVASVPPPPPPAPSPTASEAPAPTPSPIVAAVATTSTEWPELPKESGPRPSAKALEAMRQKLKVAFEPCVKIPPKQPQGIPWMVHFEFDAPSGQPVLVEVSRPFKGTLGGACMMKAALDAKLPPFDGSRWAIDLRFGP